MRQFDLASAMVVTFAYDRQAEVASRKTLGYRLHLPH